MILTGGTKFVMEVSRPLPLFFTHVETTESNLR